MCKGNQAWHNLSYVEWLNTTSPSDKTVLMVHGLTSNSHSFDVLAEFISAKLGHRCVSVDIVGRSVVAGVN